MLPVEPCAPQQPRPSRASRMSRPTVAALEAPRWPLADRSRPPGRAGRRPQVPPRSGATRTTITTHVSAVSGRRFKFEHRGAGATVTPPSSECPHCVNERLDHTGSLRRRWHWHPGPAAAAALCRSPSLMIPLSITLPSAGHGDPRSIAVTLFFAALINW